MYRKHCNCNVILDVCNVFGIGIVKDALGGIEKGHWKESNGICIVISQLKYCNCEWIENQTEMRLFVV